MTDKLDFSNLKLKEIELVTEKPKVLILDKNSIGKIDKLLFQPQLLQLSIAHNDLIQINGLNTLNNLTVLNLSHNKIISIDGLKSLKSLTWLNLSNNRIKKVENLEHNLSLKHLDLSDNLINKLTNINYLVKLKTILLHGNEILTLENFSKYLPNSLEILSLAENCLSDLTEIQYLKSLVNLKQLSLKENPCVNQKILCDYRPYLLLWCPELRIVDGSEVTEKEKLITEWLLAQGEIRHFKVGQHADLIYYLTQKCYFTNAKNKSKLQIELDNILEQRKKLSSRGSTIHEGFYNNTTSSAFKPDTFFPTSNHPEHISILSTDIQMNDHEDGDNDDTLSASNSSMLISESSFLPVVISPQKPLEQSQNSHKTENMRNGDRSNLKTFKQPEFSSPPSIPADSLCQTYATPRSTETAPLVPQFSSSPASNNKENKVPLLKYSNEKPKLYHKNDPRRLNILNRSIDESRNRKDVPNGTQSPESSVIQQINEDPNINAVSQTRRLKQQHLKIVNSQRNNNATAHEHVIHNIPIDKIISIQSWWRGTRARLFHPIVKKYLKNRENERTKSHILFLQKQMKLYYQSYEQQRKVNSTQSQAITFLIDQVKSLCKWKEDFTIRESQYQETLDLLTNHQEDQRQQQLLSSSQLQSSSAYYDHLQHENQQMSLKMTEMKREIEMLRENLWKMEGTMTQQQLKLDETINNKLTQDYFHDQSRIQSQQDNSAYDGDSYSDPSDLKRVKFEAQKYLAGDYVASESETNEAITRQSELQKDQITTNSSTDNQEKLNGACKTKLNNDEEAKNSNENSSTENHIDLTGQDKFHDIQVQSEYDETSKQFEDISEDNLGDTIVGFDEIVNENPPFKGT